MNILVSKLIENNYKIALTESCTGGALAHQFTRISGSSNYFVGSVVAYHKDVKVNLLGIDENIPLVSKICATQMVYGLSKIVEADIYVSTTGTFGPRDTTLVYSSILFKDTIYSFCFNTDTRDRMESTDIIINKIITNILKIIC